MCLVCVLMCILILCVCPSDAVLNVCPICLSEAYCNGSDTLSGKELHDVPVARPFLLTQQFREGTK